MTVEEINKRIAEIKSFKSDDERAHDMEDSLRSDFIDYIAEGGVEDLQEKAKLVASTAEISFCRWTA